MSVERDQNIEPPPLPPKLLAVWPVVVVGVLGWLIAAAVAFLVPAAARRGARGAQSGLETFLNPK
jgi:hypothetical protein